MTSRIRKETRI